MRYPVSHPHQAVVHDGLVISEREKDKHPNYDWHGRHSDTRYRMIGQARLTLTVQGGVALHRTRKAGSKNATTPRNSPFPSYNLLLSMNSSQHGPAGAPAPIRIAAAVIADDAGRVLLVRKRGTAFFMQPGGKLHEGETRQETLARELNEELGCRLVEAEFLGDFSAPAANEARHIVEAALFSAKITGDLRPAAEIEEIAWVEPSRTDLSLAPLTRDHVLPLILSRRSKAAAS